MSSWEIYNPNPSKSLVGDYTVRAISKALNQDWETTYAGFTAMGFELSDMPSANRVLGRYLRRNGFHQHIIDDYDSYMEHKHAYRSGDKSSDCKQRMIDSLERHMDKLTEEIGEMGRDAECQEERDTIMRYVDKLKRMM